MKQILRYLKPYLGKLLAATVLKQRIRMQGFIIFDDYGDRYPEFASEMGAWIAKDKIRFREHVTEGLEAAPAALIGLLRGENFGKAIVKIAD